MLFRSEAGLPPDPTLGALLISAIAGLVLKIRVKVRKKKTNGDESNIDVDFQQKQLQQQNNEVVTNEK